MVASAFFIVVYLHIFRGLLYGSYKKPRELVWICGMFIYLCMMAEAFFGYLLPFFLPWLDRCPVKSVRYRGRIYKLALAAFAVSFLALGYLGLQPVTDTFTLLSRLFAIPYFGFFLLMPLYTSWEKPKSVPERVR